MTQLFTPLRVHGHDAIALYRDFYGGQWQDPRDRDAFEVTSPATGQVIARVAACTAREVEQAIEFARRHVEPEGFLPTQRLEVMERARHLLREHQEEIAETIVLESGKPIHQARREVHATSERLLLTREETGTLRGEYLPGEWVPDTEGKFALVTRKPLGVVATLSPFNYPLFIGAAKIIPALLSGNAVVAKPSSDAPLSLLLFARILQAAGVPDGMLNVLTGRGSEIGKCIMTSPHVAAISFTGSTTVGETIAANAGMKKLHLELGGKAAAVVLDDADLPLAAEEICKGTFKLSGQRCDAISRVLVHPGIKDPFISEVMKAAQPYRLGDPLDENTALGPLINAEALAKVKRLVESAVQGGARLLQGGTHEDLFYQPTILDHVQRDMDIARQEIFGPVMPIITFEDDADALALANDTEYGLDGCLFTTHLDRALDMATGMQDGTISINAAPSHGVGHFPFGGTKRSGLGREGLRYSVDELTQLHTIVVARHCTTIAE